MDLNSQKKRKALDAFEVMHSTGCVKVLTRGIDDDGSSMFCILSLCFMFSRVISYLRDFKNLKLRSFFVLFSCA